MTKSQVIHAFFSSYGLLSYEENTVPSGPNAPTYPYLTYSYSTDSIGREVSLTCNLYYLGSSWAPINDKVDEISRAVGLGGRMLSVDGGAVWIRRGTPFAQRMSDPNSDQIRRVYINFTAEFLTAD